MTGAGVFGMLSIEIGREQCADFEAQCVARPEGWPAAQLGTDLVPHSDGFLPEDPPLTIRELLPHLASQDDQYLGYSLTRGGHLELDAYFDGYDSFHCWFDAYALIAWEASRLGGRGWGAFIWDDECVEPVVFELTLSGNGLALVNVDPQNSGELLRQTQARCDAIRSAARAKLG
ncbi:MAG: hypothetical protein R3B13_32705 [Polyangiaceae bacterium]